MAPEQPPEVGGFWQQLPDALLLWPNRITLLRILAIPLLFWLAVEQYRIAFAVAFACMGITDLIDGFIARWRNEESPFGAKFDSIADLLFSFATLAWMWVLFPAELGAHSISIAAIAAFVIGAEVFAYFRYGHIIAFHNYLSKATAAGIFAFVLVSVLWQFSVPFFYAIATLITLAMLENVVIMVMFRSLPENTKSLIALLRRKL